MARFCLHRLLASLVTLWVIASLTFLLMHAVPGGPFDSDKRLPEAILRNLERKFGLDQPPLTRYLTYMKNLLRWDLGPSIKYEAYTVNQIINRGFPISATLGALAITVAVVAGIVTGVISALRQYQWQDYAAMTLATIGFSVPSFVLASLLIYLFSYQWQQWFGAPLLPAGLWGTPARAILPAISLAALPTAFIARLVRSNMMEVLAQDYIRTARAKGLPGRVVIYRHAMKNALLPVLTYLGPLSAGILTGSFVVERIFAIPGMGREFVTSIANRDYTVIMGTTMFYSLLLVVANFAVDVLYGVVDPRIQVTAGGDEA